MRSDTVPDHSPKRRDRIRSGSRQAREGQGVARIAHKGDKRIAWKWRAYYRWIMYF